MIRIILVDDHEIVRLGLIEVIGAHDGMEVVADYSDGASAIAHYEEVKPDVVVMDYRMPDEDGPDVTRKLLKEFPSAKILILSVYEGEEEVWQAYDAGAVGYLTKNSRTDVLCDAITSLGQGGSYFPAIIAHKIRKRRGRSALTRREMTVLEHLVQGNSNKEIADHLSISLATVKLHVSNLFQKMDVADRTQAAVSAIQRGIVHLDD